MTTRQDAVKEVSTYISHYVRDDVNIELLASEIVTSDTNNENSGHGEVSGYYTINGTPLVVSFDPVTETY